MPSLNSVPQNIKSLLTGVEDGDSDKVQSLLEQDISVETTDDDGNSLLHIASANGHENVVRILLIKGAALDRKNQYGWTPLMQGCRYGHESVVLHLLNNKADINVKTMMGVSPLTVAVRGGHSKIVEILFANNYVIDNTESVNYFTTPLMVAAQHGRDDVLRSLLRYGVPSDQCYKDTGWTALMVTAMTGQLPMARLLVDKGCNPNKKNRHDKTALAIATECELREVRGYLNRKTTDKPAKVTDHGVNIIAAVKRGDYKEVEQILLNYPSECNATTPDGATPLMYAAISGQTSMIRLLIQHGADVNARDHENQWTALMQATYYGKVEAAKCLIGCKADVNCRTKNNITAFDMALLINADTSLFRLLAEHAMHSVASDGTAVTNGSNQGSEVDPNNTKCPTMAWQNTVPCEMIVPEEGNKELHTTQPPKKGWWSKVSRSVKSIKLTKTFRNTFMPNRVDSFENTLIASGDNSGDKDGSQHGNSVTIADPYSMTNHSAPKSRLPEEKLSPIVPPFQTAAGPDKQSSSLQKKNFGSKSSMSTSLNSSGESSVSRSVVKPFKFLHSPGNSGRSNNGSSPHSSGSSSDVTHSLTLGDMRGNTNKDRHNNSGDRYSDTILSKMAQMRQRKEASATARTTGGRMRSSISAEQLQSYKHTGNGHRRANSRAGSAVSSRSTSSTLTPPRSPDSASTGPNRKASSRYTSDTRSTSSRGSSRDHHIRKHRKTMSRPPSNPPSLSEEDELSVILRKLSLENYQFIFEKEEIDMDTFLTMTNGDLRELGIMQEIPRQQILKAISQLKNNAKENTTPRYSYSKGNDAGSNSYVKPPSVGTGFKPPSWSYNTASTVSTSKR